MFLACAKCSRDAVHILDILLPGRYCHQQSMLNICESLPVKMNSESGRSPVKVNLESWKYNSWGKGAFPIICLKSNIIYEFGRWAVKEAAYKALYPHTILTWHDLTLSQLQSSHHYNPSTTTIYRVGGKPKLDYDKSVKFHVSISHEADLITAVVLAELT